MFRSVGGVMILLFSLLSSAVADDKTITFLPHWVNQAQFAGYFVAVDKGIYEKYGLDVKILTGGPDSPPSKLLADGAADVVSTYLTAAIKKRSQGLKLVNVAQLVQRSSLMLVAKKSTGIESPQDLNGKKVGVWGEEFQLQPKALLKKFNMQAQLVPQSVSINLFLRDGVDVASATWYNEYHTILNSGINPEELTAIFYDKYGLNFPEEGLYCLEDYFNNNREQICKFVQASLEGWAWAFENKEEALKVVMKYVNASRFASNVVHQRWMLSRMQDLVWPDGDQSEFGKLDERDYHRVVEEMLSQGEVTKAPVFNDFSKKCEAYVQK